MQVTANTKQVKFKPDVKIAKLEFTGFLAEHRTLM